ncbi:hypothetical protein E2C01_042294 [Portunus trituberculatus]|uniref:Uncharacterized protein n=1 Tax=Portunus trituberculatus TaxID=210409 RepID=A0A5B7FLF4_PORTR|nr:hypothetical protein [Portunus trituberculatus]
MNKVTGSNEVYVLQVLSEARVYHLDSFAALTTEFCKMVIPEAVTRAGFDKVDDDDVQDPLESHGEPLSNYELIEQDKASQEREKEGDEEEPVRGLDIKTLRECLGIGKPLETLMERDPNPARSSKVAHDVEKSQNLSRNL